MTNTQQIEAMLEGYAAKNGYPTKVEKSIKELSYNSTGDNYLCKNENCGIDLDGITHGCYRQIHNPESLKEDESVKSADCLLINQRKEWFLIEFKDAKLSGKSSIKKDISIKAYSSVIELLDIIYDTKDDKFRCEDFAYDSPIEFIQNNVNYILVYSSEKNPMEYKNEKNYRLVNEKYCPEYMKKLKGYLFNTAYAMSELTFENEFLKNFEE